MGAQRGSNSNGPKNRTHLIVRHPLISPGVGFYFDDDFSRRDQALAAGLCHYSAQYINALSRLIPWAPVVAGDSVAPVMYLYICLRHNFECPMAEPIGRHVRFLRSAFCRTDLPRFCG